MKHFEQIPEASGNEKPIAWKKLKGLGGVIVLSLSAILSLPGEPALGQGEGEAKNAKASIEQSAERASEYIRNIIAAVKEKGQEGKMGRTPVRRLTFPSKDATVTVGYTGDGNADWFIYERDNAAMRFLDKGVNGSVDRVIINKAIRNLGVQQKTAENDLNTLVSIEDLAHEAHIAAGLKPEEVKIYEISLGEKGSVIRMVDFQTGETSELSGPEADQLVNKVQDGYTSGVQGLDNIIEK